MKKLKYQIAGLVGFALSVGFIGNAGAGEQERINARSIPIGQANCASYNNDPNANIVEVQLMTNTGIVVYDDLPDNPAPPPAVQDVEIEVSGFGFFNTVLSLDYVSSSTQLNALYVLNEQVGVALEYVFGEDGNTYVESVALPNGLPIQKLIACYGEGTPLEISIFTEAPMPPLADGESISCDDPEIGAINYVTKDGRDFWFTCLDENDTPNFKPGIGDTGATGDDIGKQSLKGSTQVEGYIGSFCKCIRRDNRVRCYGTCPEN